MVDSNPINKGSYARGLTSKGRDQVLKSIEMLKANGIESPLIWYDNGARATQTAELIGHELSISRTRIVPEFRWLEARGLGSLDGTDVIGGISNCSPQTVSADSCLVLCLQLREAMAEIRKLDALDIDNRPGETDDGTPNDSVNDVFSRMRNTIAKIEVNFAGDTVIIVGGDATVLSIFAAAACAVDLRDHSLFELEPGHFFDLNVLIRNVRAGKFVAAEPRWPTEEEVQRGRAALREIGPRVFADSEAGSWVLSPDAKR